MANNFQLPEVKKELNGEMYMKDGAGNLCPLSNIKEVDLFRDELVQDLMLRAINVQEQLRSFKRLVLDNLHSFVELSAEKYGAKIGGKKGNVQFLSFDQTLKICIHVQEKLAFDERLQAAKILIDECLSDWSQNANTNLQVLITDAFKVNKQGRIDTRRILSLRKLEIHDPRWHRAMEAIGESLSVQHSKEYVRFYIADEQGQYEPVSLDIAGL
ncbi:DUF3164 family protein [Candidatus Haliotispira prima]|uniref:DUF3164 family protein n=1 Tax=Candidatus Haliotispira prima TaxID=3034016 RepID=A0ABY8MHZ2_9SPIO|nr:DUF3164 family protein [Candidatus Haliotispira prima]